MYTPQYPASEVSFICVCLSWPLKCCYLDADLKVHQNLHLSWLRSLFQMSADDVVFLASPLTFDPSVVDIFLALSSGAQLLIVPSAIKKMPGRLARLLFKHHKTTVLQASVKKLFYLEDLSVNIMCFFFFLVCAGHADAACPLRAAYPETGSVVLWLLTAGVGSGGRGLPLASAAEELETREQQNPHLQYLRYY